MLRARFRSSGSRRRRINPLPSPRRSSPIAVACTLLFLLAGCAGEPSDGRVGERAGAEAPGSAPSRDTLTVLYGSNEWLFSPSHDDSPKFIVFLPLVNPAVGPGGYPAVDTTGGAGCRRRTGALAESWEHSADYRTWTVRLREGLRWHDGEPVTAHDVEFTVELWQHPEVEHYAAVGLDSAVAVDQNTVRFYLTRPGDWPLQAWEVFYPAHLLDEKDPASFYDWEFWTRPVGNGPYRYVRHLPETMVELEANPDFHRGEPAVDRLRIRFTAAGSGTGLVELRSGNVDVLPQLGLTEAGFLEEDDRFRARFAVSASHATWLLWNRREPLFRDVRVRRAITQAIDRRALHRLLRLPERVPVTDALYTPCQFRRGSLAEPWRHDPEAARRLLAEAGWRDTDGNGVLERSGRPFRFTLIADERNRRAAVFVQDRLRRVGIRVEIRILDPSLLEDRLAGGTFEAGIQRVAGLGHLGAKYLYGESRLGPLPSEISELAEAANSEPDRARRESMYAELAGLFRADLPALWMYPTTTAAAARREIQGLGLPGGGVRPVWRWPLGGVEYIRLDPRQEEAEAGR